MVTIASLGGGASRNRSIFCLLFFRWVFFLRQVTTVPLLGNLLFPSIMCLLGGTQEGTQRCMSQTKKQLPASIKHCPVLVPQIILRDLFCFGQLGKKYFHEDGFAFPKCFPDCWFLSKPQLLVGWNVVFTSNRIVFPGHFMENCLVQLIKLLMVQRSGKAQLTGARTHLNCFAANKIQRKHTKKQPSKKNMHFFNLHHWCFCPKKLLYYNWRFFKEFLFLDETKLLRCFLVHFFTTEAWSELWVGSWFRWVMEPSNDHRCGNPLELVGWELVG